jgi:hypothetical protein
LALRTENRNNSNNNNTHTQEAQQHRLKEIDIRENDGMAEMACWCFLTQELEKNH